MKCPICEKGTLAVKMVAYKTYGIELGTFPAKVCGSCHEQWFDEKTCEKIQELEKKKGLFGLSKKSKISYSGNSLIVRIPESIAAFMKLKKEDEVIIHPEGKNKIAVEMI
ncbi:MAG: YgiT-type zinc finger protein [Nanoarchaeota archaeon]